MWRVNTRMTGVLVQGGGINRLYFNDAAGSAADAASAVAAFWTALRDQIAVGTTLTVDGQVEEVDQSNGQVTGIESTDTVTVTGNGGGDVLPPNIQALVRWRTGTFLDGREVRGRVFVPAMLEANNTAGAPTAFLVNLVTTAAQSLVGDGDSALVVYSRKSAGAVPVTAASMWTKWAQLRSRRD